MATTTTTQKNVILRITDHTGHTETELGLDAAIDEVIRQHVNAGKWIYVGANLFQFEASSNEAGATLAADSARLRELLNALDQPKVTAAGNLVGGV